MPRMIDARCTICDYEIRDEFMASVPEVLYHDAGGGIQHPMEYLYLPLPKAAEWSDRDAVVVFKKPNGEYIYPGRNDAQTPAGCERVVMKSLRAVEKFERETGTMNEAVWCDRGSGKSIDDYAPKRTMPTEEQRYAAFMKGWRG